MPASCSTCVSLNDVSICCLSVKVAAKQPMGQPSNGMAPTRSLRLLQRNAKGQGDIHASLAEMHIGIHFGGRGCREGGNAETERVRGQRGLALDVFKINKQNGLLVASGS